MTKLFRIYSLPCHFLAYSLSQNYLIYKPLNAHACLRWLVVFFNNVSNDIEDSSFLIHNFEHLMMITLVASCKVKF
jgi:hypothetical protein